MGKYKVTINLCPRCKQAPAKQIAHANSVLLVPVTYYLRICTNRNCNAYAWMALRREGEVDELKALKPMFVITSKYCGIPRQSGLTS